jgi:hypothetical protein
MGALCSKGAKDNFAGAGRTVGSVPPSGGTAPVPGSATAARKVGAPPPRRLGGGASATGGAADDARRRAAEAAQVRFFFPFCARGGG